MSYIGSGRKSNPDTYNPLFKQAILVINQEFYHQFHRHFQYSFAVSYRREHEYSDSKVYEYQDQGLRHEARLYGRFSYILRTEHTKFVSTFRQEFRKFYAPGFTIASENFQLRTRLRLQLTVSLDPQKTHRIIAGSEQLFSAARETNSNYWNAFNYRESRFSLYYSYSPQKLPFIFNVGYMHDLVGYRQPFSVHYLAFDIIIENPFKLRQRAKESIDENLE
jgi:hypothetical protein